MSLRVADVNRRLADRGIELELTQAALALLAEQGYDPSYGARPLRRAIQRTLLDALSDRILRGDIADGARVTVYAHDAALTFGTMESQAA